MSKIRNTRTAESGQRYETSKFETPCRKPDLVPAHKYEDEIVDVGSDVFDKRSLK